MATARDAGVFFVSGVAYGGLGWLMLGSAVAELVDETNRRSWAALVVVLNGVAVFFAVAIAVRSSLYLNGQGDLLQASLSVVFIAASLLGLLGGLLGISLKSHENSRLQ